MICIQELIGLAVYTRLKCNFQRIILQRLVHCYNTIRVYLLYSDNLTVLFKFYCSHQSASLFLLCTIRTSTLVVQFV